MSYALNQKVFTPVPPDKGSFPLDHEGVCKKSMIQYMRCLRENGNNNSFCRESAKEYLDCRMRNDLMAKEDWSKLGCTGSVATIKLPLLLQGILDQNETEVKVNVVLTRRGEHFINSLPLSSENVKVFTDEDEWSSWEKRGDPVLHIELAKWADIFVIAPLSANSLAKLANGLCDNLLTCIARAWDQTKPLIFCPAMNTKMYEHVLTKEHIDKLLSWGYKCIPVIEKTLMCGDTGLGAMAEVNTIVEYTKNVIKEKKLYKNV